MDAGPDIWGSEAPIVLVVALALDGALPALSGLSFLVPHPRRFAAKWAVRLERRLDRPDRSEGKRLIRGALVVAIMAGLAALAGWAVAAAAAGIPFGPWAVPLVVTALLGQRVAMERGRKARRALESNAPEAARGALGALTGPGRAPTASDTHGIVRALIEALALWFPMKVVGPAFWFLLLGLPGMVAAVVIDAIEDAVARRGGGDSAFAMAAIRLNGAIAYLPSRLAGLLIALAALFAPTASPAGAFRILGRDRRAYGAPGRGWPVAAMAGALGLALGGPYQGIGGAKAEAPWIGEGTARAETRDLRRALFLFAVACLLNLGLVAALALARLGV